MGPTLWRWLNHGVPTRAHRLGKNHDAQLFACCPNGVGKDVNYCVTLMVLTQPHVHGKQFQCRTVLKLCPRRFEHFIYGAHTACQRIWKATLWITHSMMPPVLPVYISGQQHWHHSTVIIETGFVFTMITTHTASFYACSSITICLRVVHMQVYCRYASTYMCSKKAPKAGWLYPLSFYLLIMSLSFVRICIGLRHPSAINNTALLGVHSTITSRKMASICPNMPRYSQMNEQRLLTHDHCHCYWRQYAIQHIPMCALSIHGL